MNLQKQEFKGGSRVKKQELIAKDVIYIENIQNGFEDYAYEVLSLGKEAAKKLFLELREKNGKENSFLDFYYFVVKPEEREKIDELLSEKQIRYLRDYRENKLMGNVKEEIIFPMEDMLLEIAVTLNEKSALFSTMYFAKEKSTWWGNYEQKYVRFTEKS